MKAALHALNSPDVFDLKGGTPPDPEHFCLLVQALIGPDQGRGREAFDFLVCTPSWLAQAVREDGFVFGRHYLIVESYSFDFIWNTIASLCDRTFGSDWEQVAQKLGRYAKWEFEDYRGVAANE